MPRDRNNEAISPKMQCAVGPIAQSVEQRTFNPWVDGSSPSGPTFQNMKRQIHILDRIYPVNDCSGELPNNYDIAH